MTSLNPNNSISCPCEKCSTKKEPEEETREIPTLKHGNGRFTRLVFPNHLYRTVFAASDVGRCSGLCVPPPGPWTIVPSKIGVISSEVAKKTGSQHLLPPNTTPLSHPKPHKSQTNQLPTQLSHHFPVSPKLVLSFLQGPFSLSGCVGSSGKSFLVVGVAPHLSEGSERNHEDPELLPELSSLTCSLT